MAERKPETNTDWAAAVLNELARDVVDGGDVIRVHRVAHAQTISQKGSTERCRMTAEAVKRPYPRRQIRRDQKPIKDD
jgi:hypothetical protein